MMRSTRACRSLVVIIGFAVVASACGSSSESGSAGSGGQSSSTSTSTAAPVREGEPITEPVCEFLGVSDEEASTILGFEVTSASAVGSNDSDGGNCRFDPGGAPGGFEVTMAAFPDTAVNFERVVTEFTSRDAPSGGRLWTEPVKVPNLGEAAYSFESPEGGYENILVFTEGYRLLVSNKNRTTVAGARDSIEDLARAAAENI